MNIIKKVISNFAENYYNSLQFSVAGVTFTNGRKHRQSILRAIYWKDTPYQNGATITFERYDYEGNLAIGIYANNQQVGNVPADLVDLFDRYWTNDYKASYQVYGGREGKSYGMSIKVLFDSKKIKGNER